MWSRTCDRHAVNSLGAWHGCRQQSRNLKWCLLDTFQSAYFFFFLPISVSLSQTSCSCCHVPVVTAATCSLSLSCGHVTFLWQDFLSFCPDPLMYTSLTQWMKHAVCYSEHQISSSVSSSLIPLKPIVSIERTQLPEHLLFIHNSLKSYVNVRLFSQCVSIKDTVCPLKTSHMLFLTQWFTPWGHLFTSPLL